MGLLVYLRDQVVNGETLSKPGMKADPLYLIYRRNGEFLSPHPYIQKRYPRSLFALEALRRTLEYDNHVSAEPRQSLEWLTQLNLEADWAADQVMDREAQSKRVRPRRLPPE